MSADRSAFAILGLRPGAGRAEVDAAYRRLMKIYHPDRTGGDGRRAAEINRAYAYLRRDYPAQLSRARAMPVPIRRRPRRSSRAGWALALVAACLAGATLYLNSQDGRTRSGILLPVEWAAADSVAIASTRSTFASFEEPLHSGVIGNAISQALALHSGGDLASAKDYSRDCHMRLHEDPNLALFDVCAAFDESTLVLTLTDPWYESSAFGGSAVMTRQMEAASALSADILVADSRLRQIRSQVDLVLLPRLQDFPAPAAPVSTQR
ncbi:MAG TPA: J domain-containing protein [Sphingomicrobium sp.]|nr:J domain-containing protein [Sphingomicrobium sp.]